MINSKKSKVIQQIPLSEIAADELKRRIWNHEFEFGQRLVEAELASQMDISRSSLREAFLILEHEKLVINKSRKGTFLNNFSENDMKEITEIRLLLEVPALIQAAENLKEEDCLYLENLVQSMKNKLDEDDWYELFNIEMEFHLYLVNLCKNSRIRDVYSNLLMQIRTFFTLFQDYYVNNKELFYMEHKELLEAVKSGDKDIVEKATIDHIKLLVKEA